MPLVSPARAVLNDMRVDVALIVLRNTTSEEGLRHYIDMAQSLDDVPHVFLVAQAFPTAGEGFCSAEDGAAFFRGYLFLYYFPLDLKENMTQFKNASWPTTHFER